MFRDYHQAIIDSQYQALLDRASAANWNNVSFERDHTQIYVTVQVALPKNDRYLVRIDMSRFPVDPYWVGFLNPQLPHDRWKTASDSDPRFWPWSPMPGLHGSFNIAFQGPFRAFWCRECTFPFFFYHGDRRWTPEAWPLERVVAHLREAIELAEPPARWRPFQQQALFAVAGRMGIKLPEDAGAGAK